VEDPPRVAQPVVEQQPGDRTLAGLDREELLGADGVRLGRRHGHDDGPLELEHHGAGVEHGTGHGGGGHVAVAGTLVDDVDGGDHRRAAASDDVDAEPEGTDVTEVGHRRQQRRGDDPLGEHGQAAREAAQRVEVGEQATGTQAPAGAPGMVVDRCTSAHHRRLLAVGRQLPPFEAEVVADVAPPVGLDGVAVAVGADLVTLPGRGAHRGTPTGDAIGTATTLATVIRRSSAPRSRTSTTAEHRSSTPVPSTRAEVTTGPTRPSAR